MQTEVNFRAGEKVVKRIPLSQITTSHNPRNPILSLSSNLIEEGYFKEVKEGGEKVKQALSAIELVRSTVLSGDEKRSADFCRLVEKYEAGHNGLMFLAAGRRIKEIEPINLREFRVKTLTGYEVRYGIISGERRFLAAAYNHAKHGLDATIGAQTNKITQAEAEDLAFMENAQRKDMTDLEYGRYFHMKRQQVNPETGKNYNLKEVAKLLGYQGEEGYQFVRTREALVYNTPEVLARLEMVKPVKDGEQVVPGVARTRVNLTDAVKMGLRAKRGGAVEEVKARKDNRQRAKNLVQLQQLFDKTRGTTDNFDAHTHQTGILTGLALAMNFSDDPQTALEKALKESTKRVTANEKAA